MNRAALHQVRRHLAEVRALIAALSPAEASVHDAWRVTTATTLAPLLAPSPTPRLLSALYKTTIGFHQIFTFLLLGAEGVADQPLASLASPAALQVWLDREGWLLGRQQVCAGSSAQIADLFVALCGEGAPPDATAWARLEGWAEYTSVALIWQALALGVDMAGYPRGRSPLAEAPAPWLLAGRLRVQPPEDIRRLFPEGATPPAVEALLAGPLQDPAQLPHLLRAHAPAAPG